MFTFLEGGLLLSVDCVDASAHLNYSVFSLVYLTLSMPHATIVVISHLVDKVPLQELLSATELSVRLV